MRFLKYVCTHYLRVQCKYRTFSGRLKIENEFSLIKFLLLATLWVSCTLILLCQQRKQIVLCNTTRVQPVKDFTFFVLQNRHGGHRVYAHMSTKISGSDILTRWFLYLGRESNPNLIFRRDLFYPLNYQGEPEKSTDVPFSREDNQNLRKLQML